MGGWARWCVLAWGSRAIAVSMHLHFSALGGDDMTLSLGLPLQVVPNRFMHLVILSSITTIPKLLSSIH